MPMQVSEGDDLPHAEERPKGRVSKYDWSPFETARSAPPQGEELFQGHITKGGIEDRIASTLPPVFSPKIVPRS